MAPHSPYATTPRVRPRAPYLRRWALFSILVADHGDALDLDLDPRPREVRDRDEGTGRVAAVGELLLADLDEAVAVPRLFDEDGHRDEVRERSTDSLERLVHQCEHAVGLRLEVAGNILAVAVDRCDLPGHPDDASPLRDDGR